MAIDPPDPDLSIALSNWGELALELAQRCDRDADRLGGSIRDFTTHAKGHRLDANMGRLDGDRATFRHASTVLASVHEGRKMMRAAVDRYQSAGIPMADLQAVIEDEDKARATMMSLDTAASEIAYRQAQKNTADTRARRNAAIAALHADEARVDSFFAATAAAAASASVGSGGTTNISTPFDPPTTPTDPHATGTPTPDPHTKPTTPSPERYPTGVDTKDLTPAPGAGPGDPTQDRYGPITLDDLTPLPYPSTSQTPLQVDQTPAPTGQMYPGGKVPTSLPSPEQSTGDPNTDLGGADTSPVIAAGAVPAPAAATIPGPAGAIPPTAAATSAPLPGTSSGAAARSPIAHLSAAAGITNATSTAGAPPSRTPAGAGMPGMPPVGGPMAGGSGSGARSGDGKPTKLVVQSAESAEMSGINALADAVRGGTILRADEPPVG